MADNYKAGSYKITKGWVNQVQLTDAHRFTSFTKGLLGQGHTRWTIPLNDSSMYNRWAETAGSLSGSAQGKGSANFELQFEGISYGMVDYWRNTLFEGKASQQFTVEMWSRDGEWLTVWCWGYWRPAREMAEAGYRRGFKTMTLPFTVVQPAPLAPDITPSISHAPDPVDQEVELDYLVTIENAGDGDTYEDVVVEIDIPSEMEIVAATGGDFTIEYFEGGVWGSSIGVAADVTKVRGTYDSILTAGSTTSALTVTLNTGTTPGAIDVVATASTTGDSDNANDTDTDETNVNV